ncbi:GNAT family N-acetyltransferase [Thioalkalivibrio sp. ALJ16]|uniref:GNAT family N-acetyltransferase n=1 Tax=Thioalkalivibrio sp. ALJ16 TaxID=1158762 RepID=UPI0009D925AB|nr:GNAT family N-acetyltransferase [Thioalkalivibrio sp. ALJ16]
MVELVYRTATPDDAKDIARLVNSAYRPSDKEQGWTHESLLVEGQRISPVQIREALEKATILLALEAERIVGCVQVDVKGTEAHIGMLAVSPRMQTKGIGAALLAQAEEWASQAESVEEFVLVVIAARKELIQYYVRRGYIEAESGLPYPVGSGVGKPLHGPLELSVLRKSGNNSPQGDADLIAKRRGHPSS